MSTAAFRRLAFAAAFLGPVSGAEAHPHVWVTAKAQVVYADGKVTGIRHSWAFDPEYSAFVTQGLDANKDGKLTPDELSSLAATNTENLAEFGYFTKLKVAGKDQAFNTPQEPAMRMEGNALTLSFLLPLKSPAALGRGVAALEVYDPTFFVSFAYSEAPDAVTLSGAPQGCSGSVTRPKNDSPKVADAKTGMSEAFFEALTAASNFGEQFANRIIVACP